MLKVVRFGDIDSNSACLSISIFDADGRWIRSEGSKVVCFTNGYKDSKAMLKFAERVGKVLAAS